MPNRLPAVLIFFLLVSSLINSELFFYKSLTAFYGYIFLSLGIILYGTAIIIKTGLKNDDLKPLQMPAMLGFSVAGYLLFHSMVTQGELTNEYVYLLISCGLFFFFFVLFHYKLISFIDVYKIVAFVVFLECLICFLQWFNLIETENTFFPVTGSWVNPNVTAMFLAASVPFLLFCIIVPVGKVLKYFTAGVLVMAGICLWILTCRTAIIGTIVGAGWFLIKIKYNRPAVRQGKKGWLMPLVLGAWIAGLLFVFYLNNSKRIYAG